ncbi:cilia- and flagella-associated protein 43-like [Chelonus insularis]|uniref:cilia- and flagella-associated protein 43-like n=1 Tax=Chelonus insularis TaxID=460826 RepID=UPI0015898382|nr:cilia- and flagella-associated protein 43-like [Chelonus insularis]
MPTSEVKWVKFGKVQNIAFLGKEVIAIASGVHVVFINLNTKDEKVERFDSKERGEGASCLAGHPVVPMFALAERGIKPTISIFTYPAIEKISTCIYQPVEKKERSNFLFCIFGGTDYLFSLTSYPHFKLIVWSWRTGENLKIIDTGIKDNFQRMTCSASSPLLISQLGEETGKIIVYEMNICSKIILLTPVINSLTEKISSVSWTYDGNLLLCDELGNVFCIQCDGKRRYLVVESIISEKPQWKPLITDFRGGVAVVNSESRILRDSLLFCTSTGEIVEISVGDDDVPRMQMICNQGCGYLFLMAINPRGLHIAVLDTCNRLLIIESQTGSLSSTLSFNEYGQVLYSLAHPALPIIAATTATGTCNILNVVDALKPVLIKSLFLIKQPLDKMKFSQGGEMLAVANQSDGCLFIMGGFKKVEVEVETFIKLSYQIADFLIYEPNNQHSKILVLVKSHPLTNIGKYLVVYGLQNKTAMMERVIELPNIFKHLHYGESVSDIIASPYLTKQLYFFKLTKNMNTINFIGCIFSNHKLRDVNINYYAKILLTFGYDGYVMIRKNSSINQIFTKLLTHHRQEGGVKNAIICVQDNIIISLGRNGNLVASQMTSLPTTFDPDNQNTSFIQSQQDLTSFVRKSDLKINESWVEWKHTMELQREREEMNSERLAIKADFINLKIKLKKLLDENEFENKVSEYLKKFYWDSMSVPECILISLDGKTRVKNYMLTVIPEDDKRWRILENHSSSSTEENGVASYSSTTKEEIKTKDINNDEEDEEEKLALAGITSYRWIQEDSHNIVNQITRDGSYAEEEAIKLARDQISRINHCLSELREVFQLDYSVDFNWLHLELHDSERPQTVVKVEDEEVYKSIDDFTHATHSDDMNNSISLNESSTAEVLFREEALQKMMGGVLEVRWEDEIKKDIEKPQCLSKDPQNYTADDLISIKEYEKAVESLRIEKLKYKSILENEIIEIQKALQENINEFNRSVEMFFLERIKIESAVLQESLMRLQESRRHQLRLKGVEKIKQIENNELAPAVNEFQNLMEELPVLESSVNDVKNRYENLCKREKLLEGKLRAEFSDLKQPIVDYLLRHYKKRPRSSQLICTSIIYLTEVSKCILSGDKSPILPRECLDFLKGMNSLDIMPSGLPTQIDSNHWFLLCKLRRSKVEIETRIKCAVIELAEAEQTCSNHQKAIQNAQNRIQQLRELIEQLKQKNSETLHDMEIQLVLKMGQVETNLCGHPREFNNSVLVAFDQVFRVNSSIVEAGRKKLTAMNRTLIFRRTIQWKEWCHKCLNMTLRDMKEELKVLQDVKVTKEIQKYLMRHLHIVGSEKDMEAWERSIMSTKKRFRRMLQNEKESLANVAKRLNEWQKKNNQLSDVIEKTKLVTFKVSLKANDEERDSDERYRRAKLKAIMKRNRLITKVRNNYEDLLSLRSQLELLRLKTYPTLRLKNARDKKRRTINV